jgi:RHS repeat-associated protein
MGSVPATGGWVRLEVPAALVGLEGIHVVGMDFTTDGHVVWDRVGQVSAPTPASTTHLYYSAQGQVIEERQGGTAAADVSHQYVWSLAYVNALVLRDDYEAGVLVPADRLYAQQDANYNTTALVNTSGTVVERYTYSAYGLVTVLDAGAAPVPGNTSAYGWQYLFQGGRLDSVTGNVQFAARDYDPATGVWTQADPLGQAAGLNDYQFVNGNPVDELDPLGLDGFWSWFWNSYYGNYTPTPALFYDPRGRAVGIDAPTLTAGGARLDPTVVDAYGRLGTTSGAEALKNSYRGIAQAGTDLAVSLGQEGLENLAGAGLGMALDALGDLNQARKLNKASKAASQACPSAPKAVPTEPYNRAKHYGRTPTQADRNAIGAGKGQVADHDPPLVKRYYDGDPATGEKPGFQMTDAERRASGSDRSRMTPQPHGDSNQQGGQMSTYSRQKKKEFGL